MLRCAALGTALLEQCQVQVAVPPFTQSIDLTTFELLPGTYMALKIQQLKTVSFLNDLCS